MAIFLTPDEERALLNLIDKALQLGIPQKHLVAVECRRVERLGGVLNKKLNGDNMLVKRPIKCPYCGTVFEHNGKEELQVCPGCGSRLLV